MKRILSAALAKLGYQVSAIRTDDEPLDRFFHRLKRLQFAPASIIDVGANHGVWTRKFLGYFPRTDVLMVEPQEGLRVHSADLLSLPNVTWLTAGVGGSNATMRFTLFPRDDSCTFVLSPEEAARAGLRQVDVAVQTLDHIVATRGGRVPDLVKVDAEGLDLAVIDGATTLLGGTEVFLVEAAVVEAGLPNTVARVIARMDALGYRLFDITDQNPGPNQGLLWLVELAFIRRDGPTAARVSPSYA